ncbi:MAG TPA: hypothetical protein DCP91_06040 [Eggerthellaceae bacterium]|nr:hypothetical protein [Eggerthellaceae bacterium]
MMDWVDYVNFAIATSGLMAAVLGLLVALNAAYVQRWERSYFCATFLLLAAYVASDLVAQISMDFLGPGYEWLSRASVFCELLFSTMLIPLVVAYLISCAGESRYGSALFRGVLALWTAYFAVLVAAQFGDAVYTLSADGHRILAGPLFPLLPLSPLALFIVAFVALFRRRNALTRRQRIAFGIYLVVPLACIVLQAAFLEMRVIVLGTCAAALAMFAFVLSDLVDAHIRQREEAALRQAQIMALQMRPHFIYNVMSSIYYLCSQDPVRAQQVTRDFTDYLRANFDAIGQVQQVPFSKELEHTRAYLAVERARLEDGLVVEIDCPHTAFRLPPLTLQPLAENAVKHGADPELPPLHVRIASREESESSVVTVEDTGPGMQGDLPAGYLTSALANIRERLVACGATLEVEPRDGGGTVATIRMPARH